MAHQGVIEGVEKFSPEKLHHVKTREPATGAEVLKVEMAHQTSVKEVSEFEKNNLKKVETQEKNPLPDAEGKLTLGRFNIQIIYCNIVLLQCDTS